MADAEVRRIPRWRWWAGGVLGLCIGVGRIVFGGHDTGAALPLCNDSSAETDVKNLASKLGTLQGTGLTVSALEDRTETSFADGTRTCKGTVTLSDHSRHAMIYRYSKLANGTVDIRIELRMVPPCQSVRAERTIIDYFNAADSVKAQGLKGISLARQRQMGGTDGDRACKAIITLDDKTEHPFSYRLVVQGDDLLASFSME